MKYLLWATGVLLLLSCKRQATLRLEPVATQTGWAYRITRNGQPLIYQDVIPAIPGRYPFRSREDALRTGTLVLRKLQQHQLPALTVQEVDSLHLPQ